jgi:hypothetical protein
MICGSLVQILLEPQFQHNPAINPLIRSTSIPPPPPSTTTLLIKQLSCLFRTSLRLHFHNAPWGPCTVQVLRHVHESLGHKAWILIFNSFTTENRCSCTLYTVKLRFLKLFFYYSWIYLRLFFPKKCFEPIYKYRLRTCFKYFCWALFCENN